MKILLVHNSYRQPGGEDVIFEQEAQLLRDGGQDIVVYTRSNSEIHDDSLLHRLRMAKQTVWASEPHDEITDLLQRTSPDLVHVHNTLAMISPSVYSACQDFGVPVVQTLHNYRLFCPEANFLRDGRICEQCVEKNLLHSIAYACYHDSRSATAVLAFMLAFHRARQTWDSIHTFIALSNFAKGKFIQGGLPAHKLAVKPNFVYPDPGARTNAGDFVLYVGRLSKEKGVDTLLQAWTRVQGNIPLFVIGDGPLRQELCSQYSGDPRIVFRGQISRAQVVDAIKGARFLVVPSRCYENFPMAIAEAFACGVPVIAANIGAVQELISPERTGFLFQPNDATELAERIEWAWNHPADTLRMGRDCRADYESKYSAERNYESLMTIYKQTISQPILN
ncbi:MAG: glycosyl transferase family 1 [Acidobacteria bacterium]|nr:MAG: glycosyl transferase family 1 [Acidobacteriota bacterium]